MNTSDEFEAWLIDPLERLQSDANRFDRELDQVRSSLTQCYEQSLARLRDTRWVPFDAVSQLVEDLSADAVRERTRADALEADLEAAKREVENVRALYEVSVTAAQEAAQREQEETAAKFAKELETVREQARMAEIRIRQELAAVQVRSQEIVDAQMLQLVEFKRELEQVSSAKERTRMEAPREIPRVDAPRKDLAPRAAEPPAPIPPLGHGRSALTPEFAAIEAVLAGSPPVRAWQSASD